MHALAQAHTLAHTKTYVRTHTYTCTHRKTQNIHSLSRENKQTRAHAQSRQAGRVDFSEGCTHLLGLHRSAWSNLHSPEECWGKESIQCPLSPGTHCVPRNRTVRQTVVLPPARHKMESDDFCGMAWREHTQSVAFLASTRSTGCTCK